MEIAGGVAPNVVPDAASLVLNHRFAPDRTAREAESALETLLGGGLEAGDRWEVVDEAAGAPPALDHPVLAASGGRNGRPAAGEGRLDRRRHLLVPRDPGGQLRPWRPARRGRAR